MWRLNNMLLNNQWAKKKSKEKSKNTLRKTKWKCNMPKFTECSKNSSMREVHSDKHLPQETRKASHKQPNYTLTN